jgi:YaiO family outer membrane protein
MLFSGSAVVHSQEVSRLSRASLLDSAKVLESRHDYRSAVQVYLTLLKQNEKDVEAKTLLARDLGWGGELDSSLAAYRQALVLDPEYFEALIGYATVLAWKGDYTGSMSNVIRLLGDYPGNSRLLVLAARVSLWAGSVDDAIKYASEAVRVDSASTDPLLILAQAYERNLDFDSANGFVNRLLRLDPTNATARRLSIALQDEFLNKAALNIDNEDFGPENRFSNRMISLSFTRRFSYFVQMSAGIVSRDVFDSRDVAGTLGGVFRLSDKFILSGEFLYGPGTSTSQRERGAVELTYIVLSPLSVSGSFQFLQFPGTSVGLFSPSLEYYFSPRDLVTLRGYFGATSDQGSVASVLGRLTLQLSDKVSIRLGGSHGAEFYRLVSQAYLTVIATSGTIGARYVLLRGVMADLDLNYTAFTSSPWKHNYGGSLNLAYQW